jgi:hypothetical protein
MPVGFMAGSKRPRLLSATGGMSLTNATSRNVSITPPANTTMLVALVGFRMNSGGVSPFAPDWDGNAMTAIRSWQNLSNRPYLGIYSYLNPVVGVAANLNINNNSGTNWASSFVRGYCFAGASTAGTPQTDNGTTGSGTLTAPLTLLNNPYVLAHYMALFDNSGSSGPNFAETNVTEDYQGVDVGQTAYMAALNNTAVAGALNVTFNIDWTTDIRQMLQAVAIYR